jgi:hypothetical protein
MATISWATAAILRKSARDATGAEREIYARGVPLSLFPTRISSCRIHQSLLVHEERARPVSPEREVSFTTASIRGYSAIKAVYNRLRVLRKSWGVSANSLQRLQAKARR